MCLAQGHNAVPTMRLKPATPLSRDKYSNNEPLHSLISYPEAVCVTIVHRSR